MSYPESVFHLQQMNVQPGAPAQWCAAVDGDSEKMSSSHLRTCPWKKTISFEVFTSYWIFSPFPSELHFSGCKIYLQPQNAFLCVLLIWFWAKNHFAVNCGGRGRLAAGNIKTLQRVRTLNLPTKSLLSWSACFFFLGIFLANNAAWAWVLAALNSALLLTATGLCWLPASFGWFSSPIMRMTGVLVWERRWRHIPDSFD